jgi:hypothetical protein
MADTIISNFSAMLEAMPRESTNIHECFTQERKPQAEFNHDDAGQEYKVFRSNGGDREDSRTVRYTKRFNYWLGRYEVTRSA